jgi:hypothetical protein
VGAVLQRGEAGLAHHALEHHAAGHATFTPAARAPRWAPGRGAVQVGGVVGGLEVVREGHARLARMAASFSRRSAISWLSSAATGRGMGASGEVIGNSLKPLQF